MSEPFWPPVCHRCGAQLSPGDGSFYVVKIEAFADPSPPRPDGGVPVREIEREIDDLVAGLSRMSEQELMDQVYRRLTVLLCRGCYTGWIENPVGSS